MNRFLLLLLFSIFLHFSAAAQQFDVCMNVVASSGGQGIQGNRYIAWTIGEPFTQTIVGAGYAVTQGFHQPDPCGTSFVGTSDLADWGMSLFPNPTDGFALLRFSPEKKGSLLATAFDLLGRPMFENQILSTPEGSVLDASAWPPGVYFIVLQDPASQASAVLRLVRL
jgi:hypothetical protein